MAPDRACGRFVLAEPLPNLDNDFLALLGSSERVALRRGFPCEVLQ